jgi:hypothetical protein
MQRADDTLTEYARQVHTTSADGETADTSKRYNLRNKYYEQPA